MRTTCRPSAKSVFQPLLSFSQLRHDWRDDDDDDDDDDDEHGLSRLNAAKRAREGRTRNTCCRTC